MNYFLDGDRIHLRALNKKDIPIWHSWFNDSEVTEYMNKGIFQNTEEIQEEYFNNLLKSKNDLQLGIVIKKNDTLIGTIGIHKIDWVHRNGDVSIIVGDKRYWHKGIAKEAISLIAKHAFTKMNLRKLTAGMAVKNEGSKKSFERNGFIIEGRRKKHFFYKGRYIDVYLLGLLKEDWEKENKQIKL